MMTRFCFLAMMLVAGTTALQTQALQQGTRVAKPVSKDAIDQPQPRLYKVEDLTDEDFRPNAQLDAGTQFMYNRTQWQQFVNDFERPVLDTVNLGEHTSKTKHKRGVQNVCVDGRLAPELFVIGAQKSATTTFALEFRQSPSVVPRDKELHFFDNKYVEAAKGGKEGYLRTFPDCQQDVRIIAMDATPLYLYESDFAPGAIKDLYGDKAGQLKFVVILREPVERMQSAYYHGRRDGWSKWYGEITFPQLVNYVLSDDYKNQDWAQPFEQSKYVPQLKEWFQHFDPSQFIIVPMMYIVKPQAMGVTQLLHEQIWNDLGLQWPQKQKVDGILGAKINAGDHPALDDDLAPDALQKLRKLMAHSSSPKRLAHVLHGSGAKLFGCETCDKEQLKAWLHSAWSTTAFIKHHPGQQQ